jgi:NitT/TauT family transport system substrate-binding protein
VLSEEVKVMKKRFLFFCVVCLHVFLVPVFCFSADSIKIAMGYIPNVQFAPYYIADENGYFEAEGLEVSFDYGFATDIMSLVGSGQVEFGISDGDQVIIARDRGIPVRVVYTMYVKYPVAVVSFKEKNLSDVRSLAGARVGAPVPYGSNYFGLQVLLHSAGMTIDDIDLKFIGYTQVESLISDRVDAAVVFINNEPVVLKNMGKSLNVIDTYSITPMASAAIITADSLIQEDPDLVRRFVRAVTEAGYYILENKDEVLPKLQKYIPTLSKETMPINRKVLLASLELWVDEDIRCQGLGYTTRSDWESSIETMHTLGLIQSKIPADDCFTNRFIVKTK